MRSANPDEIKLVEELFYKGKVRLARNRKWNIGGFVVMNRKSGICHMASSNNFNSKNFAVIGIVGSKIFTPSKGIEIWVNKSQSILAFLK